MSTPGVIADEPKIPATYHQNKAKYSKTVISSDATKPTKAIFEVKESTEIRQLIAFAIDLMCNKQFPHVKFRGFGKNMERAVWAAEQLKRKIRNLHQINAIETVQITERFVPVVEEEGYYPFEKVKSQTVLNVTLLRQTPLNVKHVGYQKPLESKFVSTRDPREFIRHVLEEKKVPTKKRLMAEKREGKPFRYENDFDDDMEYDVRGGKKGGEVVEVGEEDERVQERKWKERFSEARNYGPHKINNQGRSYYEKKEGQEEKEVDRKERNRERVEGGRKVPVPKEEAHGGRGHWRQETGGDRREPREQQRFPREQQRPRHDPRRWEETEDAPKTQRQQPQPEQHRQEPSDHDWDDRYAYEDSNPHNPRWRGNQFVGPHRPPYKAYPPWSGNQRPQRDTNESHNRPKDWQRDYDYGNNPSYDNRQHQHDNRPSTTRTEPRHHDRDQRHQDHERTDRHRPDHRPQKHPEEPQTGHPEDRPHRQQKPFKKHQKHDFRDRESAFEYIEKRE